MYTAAAAVVSGTSCATRALLAGYPFIAAQAQNKLYFKRGKLARYENVLLLADDPRFVLRGSSSRKHRLHPHGTTIRLLLLFQLPAPLRFDGTAAVVFCRQPFRLKERESWVRFWVSLVN